MYELDWLLDSLSLTAYRLYILGMHKNKPTTDMITSIYIPFMANDRSINNQWFVTNQLTSLITANSSAINLAISIN